MSGEIFVHHAKQFYTGKARKLVLGVSIEDLTDTDKNVWIRMAHILKKEDIPVMEYLFELGLNETTAIKWKNMTLLAENSQMSEQISGLTLDESDKSKHSREGSGNSISGRLYGSARRGSFSGRSSGSDQGPSHRKSDLDSPKMYRKHREMVMKHKEMVIEHRDRHRRGDTPYVINRRGQQQQDYHVSQRSREKRRQDSDRRRMGRRVLPRQRQSRIGSPFATATNDARFTERNGYKTDDSDENDDDDATDTESQPQAEEWGEETSGNNILARNTQDVDNVFKSYGFGYGERSNSFQQLSDDADDADDDYELHTGSSNVSGTDQDGRGSSAILTNQHAEDGDVEDRDDDNDDDVKRMGMIRNDDLS